MSSAAYRLAHKEQIREYEAVYRRTHRKEHEAYTKKYRHSEKGKARMREKRQLERDTLHDNYVKRAINQNGPSLPRLLVEAKRAQLLLTRATK